MAIQSTDARDRILNAAEHLFVANGFRSTSLRAITSQAGVNLAAVNYYFGSKDALVEAVFERRLTPLNRKRLERLAELEAAADTAPPALEEVLEALIRPSPRLENETDGAGEVFLHLLAHAYAEPMEQIRAFLRRRHQDVLRRYCASIARCLPYLSEDEIRWRMHFMLGASASALAGKDALQLITTLPGGGADDASAIIRRLITFTAAGFRATATEPAAHATIA